MVENNNNYKLLLETLILLVINFDFAILELGFVYRRNYRDFFFPTTSLLQFVYFIRLNFLTVNSIITM